MREEMRKTGIDIVGDAPWGTHLCQFYQTKEDLIDILVPYFKAGLENNEFCIWVTSDPLDEKEAKKAMKKAVSDFDRHLREGQIEIVPHNKWYLKDGAFDLERVPSAWIDKLDQAVAKGHDGMRVSGNTAWLEKKDWRDFTEYEEVINNVIGKHRMLAICTYALDKCGASEVIDVVANHQFTLIEREGRWELIECSERKRAEDKLKKDRSTLNHIINLNPYSIAIYDAHGHYVRGNQAFLDLFKSAPPPDYSLFNDPILEKSGHSEEVLRLKKGEVVRLPEIRYNPHNIRPDLPDNPVLVRGLGFPILDKDGDVEYIIAMHEDISERKRAEEALKDSEEKFRTLAEQSPNMIFINKMGRVVYANKKCEEIMGYKRDEFYSPDFNFLTLIAPEYVELIQSKFAKHMNSEEIEPYEYALITKDGERIEASITTKLIDYAGKRAILGTVTDISKRKQAENTLRESEERFRQLAENIHEVFWMSDPKKTKMLYISPAYEEIWGRTCESLYENPRSFLDTVHPEDRETIIASLEAQRRGKPIDVEYRIVRPDGTVRWIYSRGFPVRDKFGALYRVAGIAEDITERKRTEEILRRREQEIRVIAEGVPALFSYVDVEGRYRFVNKRFEEWFGVPRTEIIGKHYRAFLGEAAYEMVKDRVQAVLSGHRVRYEDVLPYVHGGTRWVMADYVPDADNQGTVKGFFALVTDITERKRAEEALRESEERYRHIFEQSSIGIGISTLEGQVVTANKAMQTITGYSTEELMNISLIDTYENNEERKALMEAVNCHGSVVDFPVHLKRKDGTPYDALLSISRINLGGKDLLHTICQDITERKRAEEAMHSKIRHISTVRETAQSAMDADKPQDLARSILQSLAKVMPVDAFSFIVCNPATNELVQILEADIIDGEFKAWDTNQAYPLENNPLLSVVQSGEPFLELRNPDERTATKFVPFGDTSRLSASLMFTPMRHKGEVKGIVTVQSYTYNAYSRADLELFADVADVVGVALSRLTAEDELRKSEEIYRKAISFAEGVPYRRDYRLGAFTFVGEGITELTGYSLEEFNAGVFYKIAQEKILRGELAGVGFEEAIRRTQAGQVNKWQADYRILTRDGQTRWISDSAVQLKDTQGKVAGSLGILQDITERKQVEEELKHVHQIYREVIENAEGVPYRLNYENGIYEFFGKGCEDLIGIPSDELTHQKLREIVKENVVTDPEAPSDPFEYANAFRRGEVKRFRTDIKIVTPKGEEKWLSDCSLPIFNEKTGQLIASLGILQDVSERKRTEEALRESEMRLKEAQRIGGIGYWEFDVESQQITWSEQVYRLFERDPAKGPPTYEENMAYYYPNDSKKLQEQVRRAIEFGEEFDTDYRLKLPSGKSVYHRGLIRTAKDENGSVIKLYGTTQDISERRQAEEALKTQARVLESMVEGVNVSDENGIIFFTNPAFDAVFGYERGELIGKHVSILNAYPPEENARIVREVIEQLKTNGAFFGELNNAKKNGTLFTTYARISTLEVSGERYWVSVQEDITERKRAEEALHESEEQLRQSQKMEAIGRMAGGLAHDFNNLLTAITGYTELLLDRVGSRDPLRKDIEEVYKAAEAAASLTRRLLAFSRRQVLQPKALDLNTAIANIEKILRRLIGEDIELATVLEPNLDRVKADQGQIEQVIMNLVVNARDAMPMPEGGNLIIKTENVTLGKGCSKLLPEARPGKFVCLSVEDTGIGIDDKIIPHIFDPFFTTKEDGSGTGLGLSVVYGIVKQHEGWIDVYSKPGQGSTFKVYLPIFSIRKKVQMKETISVLMPQGRGERILVVEDEEQVRESTARMLRQNGYVVFDAENAREALDVFERENGSFHLLLSDLVLPDKSGSQLADELLSRKPELDVLISSGYANQQSQWPLIREKGFSFLQKPFSLANLLKAVKEAISPR